MNTSRRDFLRSAAIVLAALPVALPELVHAQPLTAGIQPSGTTMSPDAGDDIRPFSVSISDDALVDLRKRIAATRLPDKELVGDASQGVQLATAQALMSYWASDYDFNRLDSRLNALPQFMTTIDGVDIHFLHVKSPHPNALPLIITHGWPGSIIEMLDVIGSLTDPTAHGGSAEDAFDVVIPSIPGYGYSGKPTEVGWDPGRIARVWAELMHRLGYTGYVAQGGDLGAIVTHALAQLAPDGLLGIHLNFLVSFPPDVTAAVLGGGPPPAGISDDERAALAAVAAIYKRLFNFGTGAGRAAHQRARRICPGADGVDLGDTAGHIRDGDPRHAGNSGAGVQAPRSPGFVATSDHRSAPRALNFRRSHSVSGRRLGTRWSLPLARAVIGR